MDSGDSFNEDSRSAGAGETNRLKQTFRKTSEGEWQNSNGSTTMESNTIDLTLEDEPEEETEMMQAGNNEVAQNDTNKDNEEGSEDEEEDFDEEEDDDDEFSSEDNVEDNEMELLKQDMEIPIENFMPTSVAVERNNSENTQAETTQTNSRAHLSRSNPSNNDLLNAIYTENNEDEDKDKDFKPQISPKSRKGRQEVRIGDNYQVGDLPAYQKDDDFTFAIADYSKENRNYETPCYVPNSKKDKNEAMCEVVDFLMGVDSGALLRKSRKRKRDKKKDNKIPDDETALTCLYNCGFDEEKAFQQYKEEDEKRRNSRKGVWSERQAEMFEDAYLNNDKRKDFFAISQRVVGKSRADCVEFYYQWKKSMRYDVFLQTHIKRLYPKSNDTQKDNMLNVVNDYADKLMQGIDEAIHQKYKDQLMQGENSDVEVKTHHQAFQEFLRECQEKSDKQDKLRPSGSLNGSTISNGSANSMRENINPDTKKEFMNVEL